MVLALIALILTLSFGYGLYRLGTPEAAAQPTPSSGDCPNPRPIQQFTETGSATTDFFDVPTGQFLIYYVFPNGASGIIYRLSVNPQREGAEVSSVVSVPGGTQELPNNQGVLKVSDIPGRYRLSFSPSDPNQQYETVVIECDPSGGQSTIPSPSPPPPPPPSPTPPPPPPPPAPPPPQPAPSPPPTPPTPAPAPSPPPASLFNSGGPKKGPVPLMPNGSCPKEFPKKRGNACFAHKHRS